MLIVLILSCIALAVVIVVFPPARRPSQAPPAAGPSAPPRRTGGGMGPDDGRQTRGPILTMDVAGAVAQAARATFDANSEATIDPSTGRLKK